MRTRLYTPPKLAPAFQPSSSIDLVSTRSQKSQIPSKNLLHLLVPKERPGSYFPYIKPYPMIVLYHSDINHRVIAILCTIIA